MFCLANFLYHHVCISWLYLIYYFEFIVCMWKEVSAKYSNTPQSKHHTKVIYNLYLQHTWHLLNDCVIYSIIKN